MISAENIDDIKAPMHIYILKDSAIEVMVKVGIACNVSYNALSSLFSAQVKPIRLHASTDHARSAHSVSGDFQTRVHQLTRVLLLAWSQWVQAAFLPCHDAVSDTKGLYTDGPGTQLAYCSYGPLSCKIAHSSLRILRCSAAAAALSMLEV